LLVKSLVSIREDILYSLNRDLSLPFFLRAIDLLLSSIISTKNSSLRIVVLRIVVLRIGILQSLYKAVYQAVH
jgi:hypothetical protein